MRLDGKVRLQLSGRILGVLVVAVAMLLTVFPARASDTGAASELDGDPIQSIAEVEGLGEAPDIWGGSDAANPGWVTALYRDGYYTCSASLIDPLVVLTAAHCADSPGTYEVLVGNDDLLALGVTRTVVDIHVHPGWERNFNDPDLALLILDSPINGVPVAQLNRTGLWPEFAQNLAVLGWGLMYEGGGPSRYLQFADVFATSGMDGTYDPAYCDLPSSARTVGGIFCFGGPVTAGACIGDSGGPLVGWPTPSSSSGDLTIYGVVSYGPEGCGPSTYDDKAQSVGGHDAWIRSIVDSAAPGNTAPVLATVRTTDEAGAPKTQFRIGETVRLSFSFLDPDSSDTHQMLVDWGDGTGTQVEDLSVGARTGTMAWTYGSPGTYGITVTVRDSDGGSDTETIAATIAANTPPQVTSYRVVNSEPPESPFLVGKGLRLEVEFVDPDDSDFVHISTNWGDGSDISSDGAGPDGIIRSFHEYAIAGTFDVTFTLRDSAGGFDGPYTTRITVLPDNRDRLGSADRETGIWTMMIPEAHPGGAAAFYYGNPGDYAILGDWDCDGIDTPGLYRQSDGYVYLRNSNTEGPADVRFYFGNPDDIPLAGDFDGDGCDTISIYRPSEARIFVINKLGSNDGGLGAADYSFYFGDKGDKPFTGDFDGDGIDTVGLHRESTGLVYYRNSNTTGIADNQFIFGDPGDRIFAGDWTGDGIDTPGLYRKPTGFIYLKYTNSTGPADKSSTWMVGGDQWPIAGVFSR